MFGINKNSNAGFIAPLIVPIIIFFILLFSGGSVIASAFTALLYCLISYFGFIIFILPLHKYLKEKKKENILALLFSGMIGGALIVSVLYLLLSLVLGSRENFELQATIAGVIFGGAVAFVFCLLSGITKFVPTD